MSKLFKIYLSTLSGPACVVMWDSSSLGPQVPKVLAIDNAKYLGQRIK